MNVLAPKSHAPVTLKHIADHLGVSVTTVARSLKDGHKISPETVERVRLAARELGYVRNLDGLRLRTGRTLTLMAVLSVSPTEDLDDAAFAGLLIGAQERLDETDYSIRALPMPTDRMGLSALQDAVRLRSCDGFILDHTEPQDERVAFLLDAGVPFVTFGRTDFGDSHAWLDLDNEDAAYQATRALLQDGHRRLALVDGDPRFTFVTQRGAGYARALAEAGIALDPDLVFHVGRNPTRIREAALAAVDKGADGMICLNEAVLHGVRAALASAGRLAETGLAVRTATNLGDYMLADIVDTHLSSRFSGYHLADLLLRRIDGEPAEGLQMLARCTLRRYRTAPEYA